MAGEAHQVRSLPWQDSFVVSWYRVAVQHDIAILLFLTILADMLFFTIQLLQIFLLKTAVGLLGWWGHQDPPSTNARC